MTSSREPAPTEGNGELEPAGELLEPAAGELEPLPVGEGEAAPRFGTLDWLALQPHVLIDGLELPACHRVPAGATFGPPEPARCRVIKPGGERCRARGTRRYGVCLPHAGGGGFNDPSAMARKGQAARARIRAERLLLGIGPSGRADPRAIARVAALRRSGELARAIVDGPLDDGELGSLARQTAALRAIDATFPLQTASLELELPADGAGVQGLGWSDLQVLAARLLSPDSTD